MCKYPNFKKLEQFYWRDASDPKKSEHELWNKCSLYDIKFIVVSQKENNSRGFSGIYFFGMCLPFFSPLMLVLWLYFLPFENAYSVDGSARPS